MTKQDDHTLVENIFLTEMEEERKEVFSYRFAEVINRLEELKKDPESSVENMIY